MAVPMHLEAYLRTAEDNLTARFHKAWQTLDGKTAYCVNVYWTDHYDRGKRPKRLNEDGPIPCTNPSVAAVDPFVQTLEDLIVSQCGDEPAGRLRVEGYLSGDSRNLTVNFGRTLIPLELATGDPNQALLQSELNAMRGRLRHLEEQQSTSFAAILDSHKNLATSLASSATTRTVSSASSDLSSIAAIVGLIVLVVARPAILKFFGFKPDATADQVATALRAWLDAPEVGRNRVTVPDAAVRKIEDKSPAADEPKQLPDWSGLLNLGADKLLEQIEARPELLDNVLSLAASKPELLAKAMSFAGAAAPTPEPSK